MTHEPPCVGTKRCSKCERDLPVLAFAVDKKAADGMRPYCRECHRAINAESYARRGTRRSPLANVDKEPWS